MGLNVTWPLVILEGNNYMGLGVGQEFMLAPGIEDAHVRGQGPAVQLTAFL